MNIEKVKTYVGFAKKSNSIVYGVDTIVKKHVDLVICSDSLAENSKSKLTSILINNETPIIFFKTGELENIIGIEGVKAFAIKNKNLAKAILENI